MKSILLALSLLSSNSYALDFKSFDQLDGKGIVSGFSQEDMTCKISSENGNVKIIFYSNEQIEASNVFKLENITEIRKDQNNIVLVNKRCDSNGMSCYNESLRFEMLNDQRTLNEVSYFQKYEMASSGRFSSCNFSK